MAVVMNQRIKTLNSLIKHVRALLRSPGFCSVFSTEATRGNEDREEDEEEFRVYEIEGLKPKEKLSRRRENIKRTHPPQFQSMRTDQDWTDMWPTASTFNWSVVPFPVRQGFIESSIENEGVVPGKYANLELMKIPNFLHLTPAHIAKHCDALKNYCTAWPEGLETDEACRQHFPLEHITSDYINASPTVRDPRARLAKIKFRLSDLDLNYHARDKMIRLFEHRYNPDTDEVVLDSDRCPLKSQNLDFLHFVLTAVYFESWKIEPWESMKQLSDMEKYFWDINKSRQSLMTLLKAIRETESNSTGHRLDYLPQDVSDQDSMCDLPEVKEYKAAITAVFNDGESPENLAGYKESVKTLLGLRSGFEK